MCGMHMSVVCVWCGVRVFLWYGVYGVVCVYVFLWCGVGVCMWCVYVYSVFVVWCVCLWHGLCVCLWCGVGGVRSVSGVVYVYL